MTTSERTADAALEALLRSPAESGDYDCTVPDEFSGESGENLEGPPQPLEAPCSRRYTALRHSGRRALGDVGLIVVHCTESNSASSSAQWFQNPAAQGSAHLVVDDSECYRTLENDVIPWGAKGANTRGFHIEITGWARWNRSEWLKREATLRRAAYKAAIHAKKFGIPLRWLTPAQLRAGEKGFVTHAMCSEVFGGNHTDPGRHCPTDELLQWAKEFAEEQS